MLSSLAGSLRWRPDARSILATLVAALVVLAAIAGGWLRGRPAAEAPPAALESVGQLEEPVEVPVEKGAASTAADFERYLQRHPRDARAWVLKARLDLQADRFAAAVAAYERALAASPKVARDAGVWVELAEAKGLLQGGRLAGAPAELVAKALALDAMHPGALELAGSLAWERGDFAAAARHWQRLLTLIPERDPRRSALQAAIDAANRRARFALPASR